MAGFIHVALISVLISVFCIENSTQVRFGFGLSLSRHTKNIQRRQTAQTISRLQSSQQRSGYRAFWIVHQNLFCATKFDLFDFDGWYKDAAYAAPSNVKASSVNTPNKISAHAYTPIDELSLVHSMVYFNKNWYDRMPKFERIFTHPYTPQQILHCGVRAHSEPTGYTDCTSAQLRRFVEEYRDRYGGYHLFNNNCHKFSNRVSAFLTDYKCGELGVPE